MRLGISIRSSHPHAPDHRTGARWMVERAAAADAADLDSLFVGDHHVTGAAYYQNTAILGRLLAEWGDRPAGALYLLPLWPPVLAAEQIGTLASIARGRFVLQCALGAGRTQFAAMGASLRARPRTFESHLTTIRSLLTGDEVAGARIAPVPPDPLEVWIGATAPAAIDRAARLGDGWLATAGLLPADARRQVDAYLDACARHDRRPTAVAIRCDIHVAPTDDEARADARPVLDAGYRGMDPAAALVGGPETVAGRVAELGAMGYTDVIVRHLHPDQRRVLRSLELLPAVRAAL